ncbi:MAB_1171c family putative transporter [Kitasatospora sp. NPDC008050]|uniref:MAB_1171c family putative transporter n=1 Tax=Kitasatospora sp. NPDC008050 TaxID=3364021 RepID=UPI0036E84E10
MQQLLHPICLTLAVVGFLILVSPPRQLGQDRALAALAGVYGLSALSFLVSLDPVWRLLGEATGNPAVGILASFGIVTALMTLQLVVLANWVLPQERARRTVRLCLTAGAAVIAALVTLFFLLPVTGTVAPQAFTAKYIHSGIYQAFLTLYIGAYAIAEGVVAVVCRRRAGGTGEPWIARGLRVVGAGALLTFGYSAVRLVDVSAAVFGLTHASAQAENLAWLCADGGTTLQLTGFFIPTLAVHAVPRARAWVSAYRNYQRLGPLWHGVHEALPTIALQTNRNAAAGRPPLWGTSWHLYRRTVEIRDGQWALRHHLDQSVRSTAETRYTTAGLQGAELAAAVTADQLREALSAYHRDESPHAPTAYADAGTRDDVRTPDDDVRALLRIAAHFTTVSPHEDAAHEDAASRT